MVIHSSGIERLRSKKIIGELFERGVKGSSRSLTVRFLPGEANDPVQVAVISAKRLGIAVIRNRIRRRLRAAARECGADFVPGYFAILAKSDLADLSCEALKTELTSAVVRARKAAE